MGVEHVQFLERCFELALKGDASAFPNPVVGAVIVHQGKIIGEGYHTKYGQNHAELNSVRQAEQKFNFDHEKRKKYKKVDNLFSECTMYVSLEPCNHQGKTPPCSSLIIRKGFRRLVYAAPDPSQNVDGKGIQRIKLSGIEVVGPESISMKLRSQARYLNRAYYKSLGLFFMTLTPAKVPRKTWVTLKIATTDQGKMIVRGKDNVAVNSEKGHDYFTNEKSRFEVQKLRASHQGIITGINTILKDNPKLNVRHTSTELGFYEYTQPQIFIFKCNNDLKEDQRKTLNVFKHAKKKPIEVKVRDKVPHRLDLFDDQLEILEGETDLHKSIKMIEDFGFKKVMIEAGPNLAAAFMQAGIVDEIYHFQAGTMLDQKQKIFEDYKWLFQQFKNELIFMEARQLDQDLMVKIIVN